MASPILYAFRTGPIFPLHDFLQFRYSDDSAFASGSTAVLNSYAEILIGKMTVRVHARASNSHQIELRQVEDITERDVQKEVNRRLRIRGRDDQVVEIPDKGNCLIVPLLGSLDSIRRTYDHKTRALHSKLTRVKLLCGVSDSTACGASND